jgi:hypothetical protein
MEKDFKILVKSNKVLKNTLKKFYGYDILLFKMLEKQFKNNIPAIEIQQIYAIAFLKELLVSK